MTRSVDATFTSGGATLAGTLHLPDGIGPYPALVMLQGSGPTDRESSGYFPPIRDCFLDVGLAVLSWDKPGIGTSTGDWHQQTFRDRADEALAALRWLRKHDEVDAERTGIWGHSQGGWIGPMTAARDRDVAFLIINSGPGVDILAQDLFGVEHSLRQDGASNDNVRQALAYMRRVHEAARNGLSFEQFLADVMEPARGTPGFDYFGEVESGLWSFLVLNMKDVYDPVPTLELITCPVLAIFGERDVLVPVTTSVRIFRDALERQPMTMPRSRSFPTRITGCRLVKSSNSPRATSTRWRTGCEPENGDVREVMISLIREWQETRGRSGSRLPEISRWRASQDHR